MYKNEYINNGKSQNRQFQGWTIYSDSSFYLYSYHREKIKNGEFSKKLTTESFKYSKLRSCELCGVFSINRRFEYNALSLKISKDENILHGIFCKKCSYKINVLRGCLNLINEINKEITNAKRKNRNSGTITPVLMQHDIRD